MVEEFNEYIFSGSLPGNASTYVTREADNELFDALQKGKFCYVLNSRQSGKSSLRVRTMSRLSEAGVECASIDLSSVSIQTATQENWYADLIVKLIDSFDLDVNFKEWWLENQLNSSLLRFGNFLEKKLLAEIQENIVIFIDEIDSVLSLKFPTDDFFAFIRACYNLRPDNPEYNRLSFCLLGVASPSNLIEDKQRTPFNIGKAISLTGFRLHEVEPLKKGLQGKFSDPQAVMKEILDWTGGQPFLTQKLCQFMVEESFQDNPRSVEQVVKSRIIENWESQDEPEHLRTIRARILRDEQRAGYLLELYQQIRLTEEESEITADDTLEQSELQLSGLVVRQHNKLRVYNPIYQEIFDVNWIENQLKNLRPYSESFRFWVASGGSDESRLLRGKALQEAEKWASDKNLSYQDKQYLAASKEKEIQEEIATKEQEAALERERKDKEAAQQINQLLSEANRKAQRRINIGFIVLVIAVLGAIFLGILAKRKFDTVETEVKAVRQLNKLAGDLRKKSPSYSDEALRLSALSFNVDKHQLKQSLVLAASSQAYQELKDPNHAKQAIQESKKFLLEVNKNEFRSSQALQIQVLFYKIQGSLSVKNKQIDEAIKAYTTAFNIRKNYPNETDFTKENQFVTAKNIESVHRALIDLLSKNSPKEGLIKQVEKSLTEHFYAQLEYSLKSKKWSDADAQTEKLMLNIAKREKERFLDEDNINSFSCPDLRRIDQLLVANSDKRFGFSVQKEVWIKTGNRLGIKFKDWTSKDEENYLRFAKAVGWYNDKETGDSRRSEWLISYSEYSVVEKNSPTIRGTLPTSLKWIPDGFFPATHGLLFSRVATCKL
ncbi:AAA-like domain-containing protein [Brasilonema sp. CT11]|nr:AAA-like domain-containing protein [Brasilonema sp. CT11]